MHIHIISIGTHMPSWIAEGFQTYAHRLPKKCALHLIEVPSCSAASSSHIMEREGKKLLQAIPKNTHIVALDPLGPLWNTEQLCQYLEQWMQEGKNISVLIGGAEGLSPSCRNRASQQWALSPLIFPHFLVRVLVAEQIYRAFSKIMHHPYHRE